MAGSRTKSAGILLYRLRNKLEFFLVHPGGPFWKNKDVHAWSIPKGEVDHNEDPLVAAIREFEEETGTKPAGNFTELEPIKQKSGKIVVAWALEGDLDPVSVHSNEFEMEWPPGSGKKKKFPEIDKAAWFDQETAREKIIEAQFNLIKQVILMHGK